MIYTLMLAIPVLLILVVIMTVTRIITTDHEPGEGIGSIVGLVPIVVILGAAILIITSMANIADPGYEWDEDSGELTIQRNIPQLDEQPWDSYASDIRSIIIKPGVTQIGNSTFDEATNLEYLDISDSVTDIGVNAFGVSFIDPFGEQIESVGPGEYAIISEQGTLYLSDPSLLTFNDGSITGVSAEGAGIKYLVLPSKDANGNVVNSVALNAFKDNATIEAVASVPSSRITEIGNSAFRGILTLEYVDLPKSLVDLGTSVFNGDTALAEAHLPNGVVELKDYLFVSCSSLSTVTYSPSIRTIGINTFGSSGIESFHFPATLQSIAQDGFRQCYDITDVSFDEGFNATLGNNCFVNWKFYETDGTTVIDKTIVSNLAGKTFQGTASALVELQSGAKSLTADQTLKVAELTEIAAKELKLEETDVQASEIGA